MLGPYRLPGNVLSRNAYRNLRLPWDFDETKDLFEESSFERKDWDLDGNPSALPLADGSSGPFLFAAREQSTVRRFVEGLGSASMVIRWREVNPEKAGTDEDPVCITAKRLQALVGEGRTLAVSPSASLLLMRRLISKRVLNNQEPS